MNFKTIFGLLLIGFIICSISVVSAIDNDNITDIATQSDELNLNEINDKNKLETTQDTLISAQEDSRVIYVGQNKTTNGGTETSDNHFGSFEQACNNLSGENKVEIKVYNGTYYLDSDLKFNTSNLTITGIGEVIIKNLRNEPGAYASFGLTTTNGNFTFNNLIFDGSNCSSFQLNANRDFNVFKGNAKLGILNNCTFTNFNQVVMFSNQFDRKFYYCNFLNTYNHISTTFWYNGQIIDFEYCIISNGIGLGRSPITRNARLNLTYNNVWLGSNRIYEYESYTTSDSMGNYVQANANFGRYAIFSSYENYLENNTYEIIGELTWNDGTTEGIELLKPMTVKLSSRSGEINKTTILKNGIFKEIYTSRSEDNEIDIDLDSQEVILEFKNGIQISANPIYVEDNQIITITLPQAINGIVNITVNNKTYEVQSNGLSIFNFTVPDELLAGKYQIDVKIIDYKNHVYGMNSTNWTISKINKKIIITTPANAYITDKSINLTILMEKDASGNITIIAGQKNITKECYGRTVEIDISTLLNPGENNITVIYSGNKKYLTQTKEEKIFLNKIYPNMNITHPLNPKIGDEINITIELPSNASGTLFITVDGKNISNNNISTKNIISISNLLKGGNNIILVKYSGDTFWDSQIKKETIYVDKLIPHMSVISNQTIVKVGENITLQINLPKQAQGNITINENYFCDVNGENTQINFTCNIAGNNTINITYNGNDKYHAQSQLVNIFVEKWNISHNDTTILVTNHTTPNIVIILPDEITGNITIEVNDKKYVERLVNGKYSLKIYDLLPGVYNAIITYSGDNKFNSLSSNIIFSVPKPILSANDINMLYNSGLKYTVHVTASGNPVIGKTIILTINGKKTIAVTNNNGDVSVKIDLPPKSTKYVVIAEYQGVKIVNKIKVNSLVKAKNLKVKKSAKSLKIKVSLKKVNGKYLKGKKITLKFKNKKYASKTNKKGVAVFKINKKIIKNLKVGKKYKYQVSYLKDIVNKKITVKK